MAVCLWAQLLGRLRQEKTESRGPRIAWAIQMDPISQRKIKGLGCSSVLVGILKAWIRSPAQTKEETRKTERRGSASALGGRHMARWDQAHHETAQETSRMKGESPFSSRIRGGNEAGCPGQKTPDLRCPRRVRGGEARPPHSSSTAENAKTEEPGERTLGKGAQQ